MKDLAAERGVLAGIYQFGGDCLLDVGDILTTNSFSDPANQVIYRCLESAINQSTEGKVDLASFLSASQTLGVNHLLERAEEAAMVRAITNFPIRQGNVRKLAAKVQKLAIARTLADTVEEALGKLRSIQGDEPIDHILGLVEQPVTDFSSLLVSADNNAPIPLGKDVRGYVEHLMANPVEQIGIPTGFRLWDKSIGGGLRRKTVNMIGARPKQGKSLLSINAGIFIAHVLGLPVLYLDTEMSREDQWHRILAKLSRVSINDIETGRFVEDHTKKERVLQSVDVLEKSPFHYRSIAGQPFEETLSMMRRWVKKEVGYDENGRAKDSVIIFDYLKLMSSETLHGNLAEFQVLGFMMTGLHNFMVRHDVPCLSFAQLNRDGIDKESTDVVSQSDRIIWLCSNFSIFKKKSPEEIAEEHSQGIKDVANRKLIPLISRHGGGLEDEFDYINCHFEGEFATITEGKTRNETYRLGNRKTFKVQDDGGEIPFE